MLVLKLRLKKRKKNKQKDYVDSHQHEPSSLDSLGPTQDQTLETVSQYARIVN